MKNLKDFDIVYIVAIWNYPVSIAAYYCRKYKKPYIISPSGLLYPYATGKKFWKKWPYYRLVTKKDLSCAAAIHYTTYDEAEKCHSFLRLKNKAVVVPNGIDPSEFTDLPEREKLRDHYSIIKDKKIILFLSRIHWIKGLDILVKAYAMLVRERDDIHLLIVGNDEGKYSKKVKGWIRDYGIEDKVTFTGMLLDKEKLAAFSGSDIFVLPSYSENFGLAAVEAMACGLPVIVSDRVGIYKDVAEAKAGMIINTDVEQLTEAIGNLLDSPDICKEMGENGKQLVKEKFILDRVVDKMIEVFKSILNGRDYKMRKFICE